MEYEHFNNDISPKKPETVKESAEDDEDDDDGGLSRLFSKSRKENSSRQSSPESEASQESKEPSSIFERFKARADSGAENKADEPEDGGLEQNDQGIVASTVAEAMAAEIPEHAATEEITEAVASDVAGREYLEEVAQTGNPEAAARSKIAELNLDPAVVAEYERAEELARKESQTDSSTEEHDTEPAEQADNEAESTVDKPVSDESDPAGEEIVFDRSTENEPEDEDDQKQASSTSSGNGGFVPPPPPPSPPGGSNGPSGGSSSGPNRFRPTFIPMPAPISSGNIAPGQTTTPNTPAVEQYDQGNPAVTALIGGIIGYYIGRRRGRIKTEKKLLPIQKKLEHQVEDLHWEIKRKEIAIRKAASEKVRREGPYVLAAAVANRAAKVEKPVEAKDSIEEPTRGVTERIASERRRPSVEASQLHGAVKTQERIGQMLISAESVETIKRDKVSPENVKETALPKQRYEALPKHLRERNVETLNRNDLLLLSEKIVIDGSSLRQIYETHLIGERGLRRLVAEYLQGGDVKKILRKEIVDHEIDFERDPAVRDVKVQPSAKSVPASVVVNSKDALDKLVERASFGFGDSNAQAYYKARAVYEAEDNRQQKNKRRLIDVGMAATITLLLALVIILYFSGH